MRRLGHGLPIAHHGADGDLQGRDVEGSHIILAAALIVVVDDVLPDVVVRVLLGVLALLLTVVHDEDQHQDCGEGGRDRGEGEVR